MVTEYDEEAIAVSPDGRWLAYESNETGRTEVFLRPFPNTNAGKWQVSNDGGVSPLWSRNGRELYYVSSTNHLKAVTVAVAAGAEPRLGEPVSLFPLGDRLYMSQSEFYTPYDVAADGRFLMARLVTPTASAELPLIVVEGWLAELRQKLGGR
ncbi:MAG: PD40 domain-containing protein [Gemmatimonadetes bacterium]|nr:PD40 domain-containing protein [Gemmatimonadota bacterium]